LPTNGVITQGVGGKNIRLVGKPWGANYYLTDLSGSVDIAADISGGPVTLWINVSPNNTAPINVNAGSLVRAYNATTNPTVSNALLVPADALKFKIYYRNTNPNTALTFNGLAAWYAMFYSYDIVGATPVSSVSFGGNSTYYGALIAYNITPSQGGATIVFPSNAGLDPGEGLLFYGVQRDWHEMNPPRGY
jgi:hypothetical protein